MMKVCKEQERLDAAKARTHNWQRWGTYLPERQWGTVREDYSEGGETWTSFPHEMAQYRAYRWGEDGLLGWTDRQCRLAFSTSLWNGNDACLKERLFGLTGPQGNHGEDVKELFYYLDATPTGSYAKALYKYPQKAFPYKDLVEENARRGYADSEYELLDTGVFDEERYFDVQVEYAKRDEEDMLMRLSVSNRGPDAAALTVLPTLVFRNSWSWRDATKDANPDAEQTTRPSMCLAEDDAKAVMARHPSLGTFRWSIVQGADNAALLFTENESNWQRLGAPADANGARPYSKDAFDRYVVHGDTGAVNPANVGTKCAFAVTLDVAAGATQTIILRLVRTDEGTVADLSAADAERVFVERMGEADAFYATRIAEEMDDDQRNVCRQAFAGLLWTKQFYYYVVKQWLDGDPAQPAPPLRRMDGRNHTWVHFFARDVLSMPDKWEYPWFAAWDTAFHVVPLALIDPEFAKSQLLLLLREWYLNPDGEMPAYEFAFSDVNPPVHAWATFHVYRSIGERTGEWDTDFLERVFQKLLLNFTWWVNQTDERGETLFGGGFLGLDNIGVFDRSQGLPDGMKLIQADGTAWMGFYCSCMLQIAVELAQTRPAYEDIASKFFSHYVSIIDAINAYGGSGLWDDEVGFFFDQLRTSRDPNAEPIATKVRSIVGVIPLYAVGILRRDQVDKLPAFSQRVDWFLKYKPHLAQYVLTAGKEAEDGFEGARYLELVPRERFIRIMQRVLDETEFLSDHGVRSMSRYHEEHPFEMDLGGKHFEVKYVTAEGDSGLFGGNSNWRGPIWFPVNYLLITALERYHKMYGDSVTLECPTGSGQWKDLLEVSEELERRLSSLFLRDATGRRPVHGDEPRYTGDPHWRDLVLFNEYFCGDTGRGCGASHQTGWTALVILCLTKQHRSPLGTM